MYFEALYKSEWGGRRDYLSQPVEYALFSSSALSTPSFEGVVYMYMTILK